ncbi:MAG: carboxypeptidase regulatory-like domain-containing protein, partial [Blastocatellia bacterium]|nr:carboxypeptidase regulatory-like domain-containing protein [Blastocatellia bacterium]
SPPTHWREELLRVDHNFTDNNRLMVRYIHDSWDTITPTPQFGVIQNSFPTVQNKFTGPGTSGIVRLTQSISPSFVNEFYVSYANSKITLTDVAAPGVQLDRPAALSQPCVQLKNPNFPNLNFTYQCPLGSLFNNGFGGKMPALVFAGNNAAYGGFGFSVDPGYMPWHHTNPVYTIADNLSKQLSSHLLQFGSDVIIYRRTQNNSVSGAATGDIQGILTFTNATSGNTGTGNVFANFLQQTGSPTAPSAGGFIQSFQQDSSQVEYRLRYTVAEPYLQDNWRVNSHLNLNYGVRLSLFGRYKLQGNAYNWLPSAFDPSLTQQLGINNFGVLQAGPFSFSGVNPPPIPLDLNNLDPRITNGLMKCDSMSGSSSCMKSHLANWAPRIGFAWDPFGNGKTSIRGGYGIFYEHGTGNEANAGALEGAAPLVLSETQIRPNNYCAIGQPICATTLPPPQARPLNLTSIQDIAVWPYVQQWSLSVQRALPGHMTATVAYVGSKGTHLTDERQINQVKPVSPADNPFRPGEPLNIANGNITFPSPAAPAGDCSHFPNSSLNFRLLNGTIVTPSSPAYLNLVAVCNEYNRLVPASASTIYPDAVRPYLGLGEIVLLENNAKSSYNALQVTLRRTWSPITLGVSYTYSHSLDDSSDRFDPTINAYDLESNRANSNFDQRHLVNISYIYDFPRLVKSKGAFRALLNGWQWSGITSYASGTPFSIYNAANGILDNAGVLNGIGSGPARVQSYPDLAGDPNALPPSGTNNGLSFGPALLNPSAFVAPQGLTFGNAGRNNFNNPNRLNFDMALQKDFRVSEGLTMKFRAEAFNVFNTTQFEIFDPSLGNRGNNVISCYGPASTGSSAGDASCLLGNSFLHPVEAHRPRTLQFGLKLDF